MEEEAGGGGGEAATREARRWRRGGRQGGGGEERGKGWICQLVGVLSPVNHKGLYQGWVEEDSERWKQSEVEWAGTAEIRPINRECHIRAKHTPSNHT